MTKSKTKILLLGEPMPEYLSNMVLHGLYFMPDVEVINYPKSVMMYEDTFETVNKNNIYGKGFTIFGTLPTYHGPYEDHDIYEKVKNNYFDYVIMSYVSARNKNWYVSESNPLVKEVIKYYNKKQIILLDGHDEEFWFVDEAFEFATYFKRELYGNHRNQTMYPISFAFPEEKIQETLPKVRIQAKMKPKPLRIPKTVKYKYPFKTEQDYYNGYRESLFGLTYKKMGWDCMRHYEIIACRCLPFFTDIDGLPTEVCKTLPKDLIKESVKIRGLYDNFDFYNTEEGNKLYHDLENKIFEHFKKHCTTRTLAEYVLNVMDSLK